MKERVVRRASYVVMGASAGTLLVFFLLANCSADQKADTGQASQTVATAQSPSASKIDYGILGPLDDPNPEAELDGHIPSRSPAQNLERFRKWERNPPQATDDHLVGIQELTARAEVQRARFYAVAQGAPQLLTAQDWKWVREEEAVLIAAACDEQDTSSPPVDEKDKIPQKDCDAARK